MNGSDQGRPCWTDSELVIANRFSLEDTVEAIKVAAGKESMKVAITMK